jgi:hypothetical protein
MVVLSIASLTLMQVNLHWMHTSNIVSWILFIDLWKLLIDFMYFSTHSWRIISSNCCFSLVRYLRACHIDEIIDHVAHSNDTSIEYVKQRSMSFRYSFNDCIDWYDLIRETSFVCSMRVSFSVFCSVLFDRTWTYAHEYRAICASRSWYIERRINSNKHRI